jgi:membrane-associated protein
MSYRLFFMLISLGSFAWIGSLTVAGYYFGNIPVVKNNLTLIIVGIIVITLLPAIREVFKHRRAA